MAATRAAARRSLATLGTGVASVLSAMLLAAALFAGLLPLAGPADAQRVPPSPAVEAERPAPKDVPGPAERAVSPSSALEERAASAIQGFDRAAAQLEQALDSRALSEEGFERARAAMASQSSAATALSAELRREAAPLVAQLEALGAPPEDVSAEAPEISVRRAELTVQLTALEGRAKEAELAATRADALESRLADLQRARRADQLLTRSPGVFSAQTWSAAADQAEALGAELLRGGQALWEQFDFSLPRHQAAAGLLAVLLIWLATMSAAEPFKRRLEARLRSAAEPPPLSHLDILLRSLVLAFFRVAPALMGAGVLAMLAASPGADGPLAALLSNLAAGVVATFVTYALARIVFSPKLPGRRLVALDDATAWRNVRRATLLAAVVFAMRAVESAAEVAGQGPELDVILVAGATLIGAPLFYGLVAALLADPTFGAGKGARTGDADPEEEPDPTSDDDDAQHDEETTGVLRALLRAASFVVALAAPAAAVFGFPELGRFLIETAAATLLVLAAAGLAYDATLRIVADERKGEPGALAPLLAAGVLAIVVGPSLALIWGASVADLRALWRSLIAGIELGGERYSLFDLMLTVALFAIGVYLTRMLQRGLRRGVLKRSRLDAGLQTSISAGVGYTGVLLSGVVAVSFAGLDLSSLALVAGALSVGIGFGLQTIVNNFVSGLILLVERPIKTGDWIRVGPAEGYVRRINVRSTEIETFDKATVIVPNSDLIANQVTNLTHKNLVGRAKVRIRTTFDVDADLVLQTMREVARDHNGILRHPQPMTLCIGVADYGVDFELWAYTRDVNWVFNIRSDLTVELLKRLRAAGVTVPFPQQDIHLRSLPGGSAEGSEEALASWRAEGLPDGSGPAKG